MLRGIDVSSNQPASICSMVEHDFAIVKMSGNPQSHAWDYVNPYAKQQADDAYRKHGRVGLYHFTWGKDASEEASFFVEQVRNLGYVGKAMLVVDYEGEALSLGREWVKAFAATVERLAGYRPVIYASGSVIVSQQLVALGYPLWCANYSKGYDAIRGYNIDGCRIYSGCESSVLWQFTSQGYLDGYDGPLDLDVFYGEDWQQFTGARGGAMAKGTASKVLEIAQREVGRKDGTKYGRWYEQNVDRNPGNYDYGGPDVPYCAMFVSWVFDQAGAKCVGIPGAYCPSIYNAAKQAGKLVPVKDAKPGDVVLFDWDGGVSDHVGIVKGNDGLKLYTIEGNTDNGWVLEKVRNYGTVAGIVRPDYIEEEIMAVKDFWGYINKKLEKVDAYQLLRDAAHGTAVPSKVWGYTNKEVNGDTDAYQLLTDIRDASVRIEKSLAEIDKKLG